MTDEEVSEKATIRDRIYAFWRAVGRLLKAIFVLALAVALLGGGVFLAELSFDQIEQMRQLERTPETTASELLGGEALLTGTARVKDETVTTPESDHQVVAHSSSADRREQTSDGSRWVTQKRYSDSVDFLLETDDGTVEVAAGGFGMELDADIRFQERVDWAEDVRVTERSIYPGDEIFVVGYAEEAGDGYRISFDTPGDYQPVISMGEEYEIREQQTLYSGGLVVGSMAALLFGIFCLLSVFRIHHSALYLGAATVVVIMSLGAQGLAMMISDLRAADEAAQQTLEDGHRVVGEVFEQRGIDWDGDINGLGSLNDADYQSLSASERSRIEGVRMTMARYVQRTNDNLYRFPEFAVGMVLGMRPRSEIELPDGQKQRLEEMEEEHQSVVLDPLYGGIAVIIGVLGVAFITRSGLKHIKVKRTVENVPTSPVQGAVFGLTELKGTVESDDDQKLLRAPVSKESCVCYRHVIKKKRKSSGSKSSSWKTVKDESKGVEFYCRDETGAMLVDSQGADLSSNDRIRRGWGGVRHYEWKICPGDDLYALGTASIDPETHTELMLSDSDDEDIPFILSSKPEKEVIIDRAFRGFGALNVGIVATMIAGMGIAGTVISFSPMLYWTMAAISCGYLFLVLAIMYYNDLVFLRRRVDRGWSNIDVALKKRFELIENLGEIVQEFLGHEKELQTRLAEARDAHESMGDETPPEHEEIAAEDRARNQLIARVENHPDLHSQQMVDELMETLREVENDIALMRDGYNDAVESYNTRIAQFPEVFIALPLFFRRAEFFEG